MGEKKWYFSKTLWTNAIALVLGFVTASTGLEVPAELQITLLATINFVLRLITKEGLA